ncbi:hypothetical protein BSKO_10020 [Bryopsis sp. KO-2023]|nr:hypothetical protein BSKO_10020 [Bryopsis sp. KO-2023]
MLQGSSPEARDSNLCRFWMDFASSIREEANKVWFLTQKQLMQRSLEVIKDSNTAHAEQVDQDVESFSSFDSMGLSEHVLRGLYAYGFEQPSAIQQKAIVPLTRGYDVIAQAQSGTGKTGAFCAGVLNNVDPAISTCQALLLAPARELAMQTAGVIRSLGEFCDFSCLCFIGGSSVRDNVRELQEEAQVVVGTPGRIYDLMRRGYLTTDTVRMFVLDEADEMLSRGFKDQIYDIFQCIPPGVQTAVFSATMPPEALEMTKKFMNKPLSILVKREEVTLEGISQYYVNTQREDWKLSTLSDLYDKLAISQSVVFVNTRRKAEWLTERMTEMDHTVSTIHGDLEHHTRELVMREFRSGSSRVLITTDLLGRGIDVQQVSLVLNYDLPRQPESYIHRIGRSGRFGRKGMAINFVTSEDAHVLTGLQTFYDTVIEELPKNILS